MVLLRCLNSLSFNLFSGVDKLELKHCRRVDRDIYTVILSMLFWMHIPYVPRRICFQLRIAEFEKPKNASSITNDKFTVGSCLFC